MTILHKTAIPQIDLWVVSIVKITANLHWLYSYNSKNKNK